MNLLNRRMLVVTGKGGVGKSTVAAALALAAARRGRRVIVVEVAGRADVARAAGLRRGRPYVEHRLAPGVDQVSIDARRALREYLHRQLPGPAAAVLLAGSAFELLTAATPGLAELLTIGKAWDLTRTDVRRRGGRRHDLVILDAPSTGHGLALLRAPATFAAVGRSGPVASQAQRIEAFLHDPACTAIVAVAAAEQMAVAETLELQAALREQVRLALDHVVVDAVLPDRFSAHEERALDAAPPSPARRAARFAATRARQQGAELEALRDGLGDVPVTTLPFVFAPELRPRDLAHLARVLDPAGKQGFSAAANRRRPDGGPSEPA